MDKATAEEEMSRRLRNMHPLYTRLSGDVLWELFLECGYSDEECGALLDGCIDEMRKVLRVMQLLESGRTAGFVYTAQGGGLCTECASLVGKKVVDTAFTRLPPFAVGCGLGCRALCEADASLELADTSRVRYGLYCSLLGKEAQCIDENDG